MKTSLNKAKKTIQKKIGKEKSMIEDIAERVKTYIKDEEEIFSKENIVKYTALAIVALYGLRSSGWLRGLILSAVTGIVTEKFVENIAEKEAA
ncbi:MAG: hypothetical protein JWO06_3805 [Bacteroidota bacterium]|nr:hypothetical protein [Bacteroidota bacterium]